MDKRALAAWVGMELAAIGLTGCGKPGATGETAAVPPATKSSTTPANVVLRGQYVDGYGRGLFFTPDGGVGVIGSPDNGRYVGEGQTFRVEIAGKPPAMGYVYSPNKISVSFQSDPNGTRNLFREGSDLAAQARAEATHAPVERKAPDFDRTVPLDRYVDLSPDNTTEGITYLYVALHEPPLSDEEKFKLLSPHRGEPDAFKRRDLMQAEMAGIDAKLAEWKGKRYLKLSVDALKWSDFQPPHSTSGFSNMGFHGGFGILGPYDVTRKGFRAPCIANEDLSTGIGLLMGREETYHQTCLLSVQDESTARAIESQRASGVGPFLKSADLYFYAVRDIDSGQYRNVSVVLTHGRLQYAKELKYDGSEMESIGAPIEVDFPQPAFD